MMGKCFSEELVWYPRIQGKKGTSMAYSYKVMLSLSMPRRCATDENLDTRIEEVWHRSRIGEIARYLPSTHLADSEKTVRTTEKRTE